MLNPERKPIALPFGAERRRFQRVRINVFGRYMLSDGQECPCYVSNMSPGGMALLTEIGGRPGDRVSLSIMSGDLKASSRRFQDGFALAISATKHKRDKLAAQLTWLANRSVLPDHQRRHQRITPRDPAAHVTLPNGFNFSCRVNDISQSGAGIASDQRPEIGVLVTVGKTRARVVRYIEGGFRGRISASATSGLPRRECHRRVSVSARRAGCP